MYFSYWCDFFQVMAQEIYYLTLNLKEKYILFNLSTLEVLVYAIYVTCNNVSEPL